MIIVKVVYMNGKEAEYDVEYPKAYIAKIMERENDLMLDQKSVKEIYAKDKLIAKFNNGYLNELVLEKPKPKKTAGMGRYKGHTVPAGCDVGQYLKEPVMDNKDLEGTDLRWTNNDSTLEPPSDNPDVNVEIPLKGPTKEFGKMFALGLGLIAGVSLAVSCSITILVLLIFYISTLL